MYRSCIFCSADLKANDVLERFPVGRSIALDGEKGRLWAVCPRCARWNLAPLEERWEAIEDAERLFRDTRARVQSENIGVAKLRDGTRLIRVGAAVAGELAAWRYGGQIANRRWRFLLGAGVATLATGGIILAGSALTGVGGGIAYASYSLVRGMREAIRDARVVHQGRVGDPRRGQSVRVLGKHVHDARLRMDASGDVELHLPSAIVGRAGAGRLQDVSTRSWVLRGDDARLVVGRAMVVVNPAGGDRRLVHDAVSRIKLAGGPREMLLAAARHGLLLDGAGGPRYPPKGKDAELVSFPRGRTPFVPTNDSPNPLVSLAVEMAVHDEMERQALEGELAGLEEAWRQAEEIAAIADRLPDVPRAEPPRL